MFCINLGANSSVTVALTDKNHIDFVCLSMLTYVESKLLAWIYKCCLTLDVLA